MSKTGNQIHTYVVPHLDRCDTIIRSRKTYLLLLRKVGYIVDYSGTIKSDDNSR